MTVQTDLWDAQLADIYTLTNQPHLVAETALALRMATLKAHLSDKFARDIVTTSPVGVVTTAATTIQVATGTAFARFRDVAGVKLLDANGNPLDFPVVSIVEVNDIFEYGYPGVKKPAIAWLAGSALNIYASCGMFGAQVDWYQSPNVTRDAYDSWIAQLFPDIIIWEAAMFVWNRSGNEPKAKEAYVMLHGDTKNPETGLYNLLKSNFLNTAGR